MDTGARPPARTLSVDKKQPVASGGWLFVSTPRGLYALANAKGREPVPGGFILESPPDG